MANVNVRVVGHYADASNKKVAHLETAQHIVSVALVSSAGDGTQRLDPATVNTVLANNSKFKGTATQFIVDGYALLDKEHNPAGVLS